MVDALQAAQQLMVGAPRTRHHLKDRLEGPAVQLLVDLVPIEVHGDQAEQADVHCVGFAHSTDHVRKAEGEESRRTKERRNKNNNNNGVLITAERYTGRRTCHFLFREQSTASVCNSTASVCSSTASVSNKVPSLCVTVQRL